MAIAVHVARVGVFTVDQNGQRIDKGSPNTTINQLKNTGQDILVIPDAAIPASASYPTVKAYLEAEAASDFVLHHMDQTCIVTYNQSQVNSA